jgi:hypothetical protein
LHQKNKTLEDEFDEIVKFSDMKLSDPEKEVKK